MRCWRRQQTLLTYWKRLETVVESFLILNVRHNSGSWREHQLIGS